MCKSKKKNTKKKKRVRQRVCIFANRDNNMRIKISKWYVVCYFYDYKIGPTYIGMYGSDESCSK